VMALWVDQVATEVTLKHLLSSPSYTVSHLPPFVYTHSLFFLHLSLLIFFPLVYPLILIPSFVPPPPVSVLFFLIFYPHLLTLFLSRPAKLCVQWLIRDTAPTYRSVCISIVMSTVLYLQKTTCYSHANG
jgi:hypothetical protein